MNGHSLQQRAAQRSQELPGAELTHPFGPDWDVFKVHGKVFMLQTDVTGESLVVLKAAPQDGQVLQQMHAGITPGYHMNKKHWITLRPDDKMDTQLVEDLVTESYLLVIERNLPKAQWPVDPSTFGQTSS